MNGPVDFTRCLADPIISILVYCIKARQYQARGRKIIGSSVISAPSDATPDSPLRSRELESRMWLQNLVRSEVLFWRLDQNTQATSVIDTNTENSRLQTLDFSV